MLGIGNLGVNPLVPSTDIEYNLGSKFTVQAPQQAQWSLDHCVYSDVEPTQSITETML